VSSSANIVLLTGGSGFIGARLQSLLVAKGYRLRVLTRKPDRANPSIDYFIGDLTDASTCGKAIRDVRLVIHIAGEKRDELRFWPVNVQGTRNLIDAAVEEGVERFVHLSSVGVIGADPLQPKVLSEETPCAPTNKYERSKWEAEQLVQQAAKKGLQAAILRPSNVFGEDDPERGLLRLIQSIKKGWFFFLGGRGVMCNYVFVEDVAHACLSLAEHPNAVGRIYHLSDDCTLGEFIDVLADELKMKRPGIYLPDSLCILMRTVLRVMRQWPGFSKSSVGYRLISLNNQARFATTRIFDELGFSYLVGWRAGLGRIMRWYRSQGEL
jgi:nucleoside-diphosphate-sugar epimerase